MSKTAYLYIWPTKLTDSIPFRDHWSQSGGARTALGRCITQMARPTDCQPIVASLFTTTFHESAVLREIPHSIPVKDCMVVRNSRSNREPFCGRPISARTASDLPGQVYYVQLPPWCCCCRRQWAERVHLRRDGARLHGQPRRQLPPQDRRQVVRRHRLRHRLSEGLALDSGRQPVHGPVPVRRYVTCHSVLGLSRRRVEVDGVAPGREITQGQVCLCTLRYHSSP